MNRTIALTLTLFVTLLLSFSVAFGQAAAKHAPLTQQKICSEQARRAFNESYEHHDKSGVFYEYTSHFDTQANVCYVMVHGYGVYKSSGYPMSSDTVFDAIEGRSYASFIWINSKQKQYSEVEPVECSVSPRGQEPIQCKSSDEFERLIDKHFGIGL